jgi:hypothetical protein
MVLPAFEAPFDEAQGRQGIRHKAHGKIEDPSLKLSCAFSLKPFADIALRGMAVPGGSFARS